MSVDVQGRCPACGHKTLFLGSGGYVTCRIAECPDPGAASDLLVRPVTVDHYGTNALIEALWRRGDLGLAANEFRRRTSDGKVGKVNRWNVVRSQLRHQGLWLWLHRRAGRLRA